MKSLKKRPILLTSLAAAALMIPLLFSTRITHKIRKLVHRALVQASALRGTPPRLLTLTGKTSLPGAQVQALDSLSGWATLCDREGRFRLPDVLWYAGASYELVVTADDRLGKQVKVSAPAIWPQDGVFDVGEFDLATADEVDMVELAGVNSETFEGYDFQNRDYYRRLFDELTTGLKTDEERVAAINRYVATRLNYRETQWELGSPRRIIEHGSQYCGHLGAAMESIAAVGYKIRGIHLSDRAQPPHTHAVVEVFYRGAWHLYDPTFGIHFHDRSGNVASYRALRLDPQIITPEVFADFKQKYPKIELEWMKDTYDSGYHHFYYPVFECSQYAHAWWEYQNGLDYVPVGGKVWLAAAGIRPGTGVTFHVRKPGVSVDELTLQTSQRSNSGCVLNQEESPPLNLSAGEYEVYTDYVDGNVPPLSAELPATITAWRLRLKLAVR